LSLKLITNFVVDILFAVCQKSNLNCNQLLYIFLVIITDYLYRPK